MIFFLEMIVDWFFSRVLCNIPYQNLCVNKKNTQYLVYFISNQTK